MGSEMVCMNCGWMYAEAKEGKAFADVGSDWVCPTCGCPTELFEPLENSVWKSRPYGGSLHPDNEGLQDAVRDAIKKDVKKKDDEDEEK